MLENRLNSADNRIDLTDVAYEDFYQFLEQNHDYDHGLTVTALLEYKFKEVLKDKPYDSSKADFQAMTEKIENMKTQTDSIFSMINLMKALREYNSGNCFPEQDENHKRREENLATIHQILEPRFISNVLQKAGIGTQQKLQLAF